MSAADPPLIAATHPDAVAEVIGVLRSGGTVVLPTDTVYGLAASPDVPGAVPRLFSLKARSEQRPVAVLVADVDQALELIDPPTPVVERWMATQWPGPLTLVLRRSATWGGVELGGGADTIGVRCPDHDLVRSVAAELGPIATTSANRHGAPTPATALEAARSLDGAPDLVVDGGPAGTVASTVVDASIEPWQVLRVGAIPAERL